MRRSVVVSSLVALSAWAVATPAKQAPSVPLDVSRMAYPPVNSIAALVMDADSGRILWAKNPDQRMYPASTTKILTSLLLVENTQPTDILTAPADIKKIGESSIYLEPGEKLAAHDLLYAMMLRSANDACVTVARHIAGTDAAFSKLMNDRARALGAVRSHFVTPNGLHDVNHFTTARDLALISREAMNHQEFSDAAMTQKFVLSRSINQKNLLVQNRNKQLAKDPTCIGIKTGYTKPAGHCFVGSAERKGWRLITVVLNSKDWQEDHRRLLQWGFSQFRPTLVASSTQQAGPSLPPGFEPIRDLSVAVRNDGTDHLESRFIAKVSDIEPITVGQEVGEIVAIVNGKRVGAVPVRATMSRPPRQPAVQKGTTATPIYGAAAAGALSLLVLTRGRRRR